MKSTIMHQFVFDGMGFAHSKNWHA